MFTKFKGHSFLIFISALILGLSIVDWVTPDKRFSELENRLLQKTPSFSLHDYLSGKYTSSLESAINDQFILRNDWINLKSRSELLLGKRENNTIILGDNGYLFKRFDTVNRATLTKNLGAIITFSNTHPNLPVYFMLVPNSYALLPNLMPDYILKVNQIKCINYIYKAIENDSTIQTVNVIPAFLRHKDDYIYYHTDHHWTSLGAYLAAYRFICSTDHTPASPNPLIMPINEIPGFYGTYFNESKFVNVKPDTIKYISPNVSISIDGKAYPSLYDETKWTSSDKYAAFIWGNNSLTSVTNNDLPEDGRRLLLIKDSFGNSLVPFIAYNYRQIDIIDLRSITFDLNDYLKERSFDEVLILYNFTNFNNDRNISKLNY